MRPLRSNGPAIHSPAAASRLKPIIRSSRPVVSRAAMDDRPDPTVPDRFKPDTFPASTGIPACIDVASSVRTHAPAGVARSVRSRRRRRTAVPALNQIFRKVRVRHTGKTLFSVQDASGDTMKTSTTISIAASPGMNSDAATIAPRPIRCASRAFPQAFAPARNQRTPALARPPHTASLFTGMRVCVPPTMGGMAKRAP